MSKKALVVLTRKSVETVLETGGTQSWDLDRAHAMRCPYVVLCRNANHPNVEGTEPHREAFMIGRRQDIVPSNKATGRRRWLVTFAEYAPINVPDVWKGWRNPVHYSSLDELGIDLDGIEFQPMPGAEARPSNPPAPPPVFGEALKTFAATLGVKPEAIQITIRG